MTTTRIRTTSSDGAEVPAFLVRPAGDDGTAPFVFAALLPLVLVVVLMEISEGGLDPKAVAMLGVLAVVGAALRPLGAGTAGLETVFFLLVLAGRVFGPGFGFVLGAVTLFASALLTGGVDRPGLDLAAMGRLFTRLTENHTKRMENLGLDA